MLYKIILKNFLFLLGLILVTLSLLEAAISLSLKCPSCWSVVNNKFIAQKIVRSERNVIQFMDECSEYDKNLTYKLKSGVCSFSNIEYDTIVKADFNGFRQNIDDTTIEVQDCTMLFIGDSLAMGWGVESRETFGSLLAQHFDCKGINMAMSSYGTARQVASLNLSNFEDIDYIIWQYADNDLKENKVFYSNKNYLPIMSEEEYNSVVEVYQNRKKYYFFKYTYTLFNGVYKNIKRKMSVGEEAKISNSIMQEEDYFINALSYLKKKYKNANLVLFEINSTNRNDMSFIGSLEKKYLHKMEEGFFKVSLIDMSKNLTDDDYFVFDDHMNAQGHRAVSDKLISALIDSKILKEDK